MSSKAFTLIELLVVVSLIAILSAIVFLGRTGEEDKLVLQRSASKLAQDIRRVQEMAMGAEEGGCSGVSVYDFGLYFDKISSPDSYTLFVDCNQNQTKDSSDKTLKQVKLEGGVGITKLEEITISTSVVKSQNKMDVIFTPPDPVVFIEKSSWDKEMAVTLSFGSAQRKVRINTVGMVEIE